MKDFYVPAMIFYSIINSSVDISPRPELKESWAHKNMTPDVYNMGLSKNDFIKDGLVKKIHKIIDPV